MRHLILFVTTLAIVSVSDSGACGGTFTGDSGVIKSPNYPSKLESLERCRWTINIEDGYVVQLSFEEIFDMPKYGFASLCTRDYVKATDVSSTGRRLIIGKWCGINKPPPTISLSSKVELEFKNEYSVGLGFYLSWLKVVKPSHSRIEGNQGNLSSHDYPSIYPDNWNRKWEIIVPFGQHVILEFNAFDLGSGDVTSCNRDRIEIFDVFHNNSLISLGQWCGSNAPPPIKSVGSRIFVEFYTDSNNSNNGRGFDATWTANDLCGGYFTTDTGMISSPNYPYRYKLEDWCRWRINVTDSHLITLTFVLPFHIHEDASCRFNYVKVFDVLSDGTRQSKGTWCGSNLPTPLTSASSVIDVELKSWVFYTETGFSASWLKVDADHCLKDNGGCDQICHNIYGSHYCGCRAGYTYNGTNCNDIDECQENNGGCYHSCHNTIGSYTCSCLTGYRLKIKVCSDIDECQVNNGGCNQSCNNTMGSYECYCNTGFFSEADNCTDIDECQQNNGGCDQTCNNTMGSYECSCGNGYFTHGRLCSDIDECQINNRCDQTCNNTIGSYECSCVNGYSQHGRFCSDIDECQINNRCDQTCNNTIGSYECSCVNGYSQHGRFCSDIDECQQNNGGCDQTCNNTMGSYVCSCGNGYFKHGSFCSDIDECQVNNGGCDQTCNNTMGSYECYCGNGYFKHGRLCSDIDECQKNNGGCDQTCNNTMGSYECSCVNGYSQHGRFCSDIDECHVNNGGCDQTCYNRFGSYECYCSTGYILEGNTCKAFYCFQGWSLYKTNCFRLSTSGLNWNDARQFCRSENAHLVSIPDNSTLSFLLTEFLTDRENIWTGLNNRNLDMTYFWADSSDNLDFTNWAPGEPNPFIDDGCVYMGADPMEFWISTKCQMIYRFICEKSAVQFPPSTALAPVTTHKVGTCPQGWFEYKTNCFHLYEIYTTWYDARDFCKSGNGRLVSIPDKATNDFLSSAVFSEYSDTVWIGLNYFDHIYEWVDSADNFNFTNWLPGQPDSRANEDCVFMDGDQKEKWSDDACFRTYHFICEKQTTTGTTTKSSTTTPISTVLTTDKSSRCPAGWSGYTTNCFRLYKSLKTWKEARQFCKSNNGRLVTIPDRQTNNFLSTEFFTKENGNIWTGLHFIFKKMKYFWADSDDKVTFTNWFPGEPNPYVPDYCVYVWAFRAEQWISTVCSAQRHFICEKPARKTPPTTVSSTAAITTPHSTSGPTAETAKTPPTTVSSTAATTTTHPTSAPTAKTLATSATVSTPTPPKSTNKTTKHQSSQTPTSTTPTSTTTSKQAVTTSKGPATTGKTVVTSLPSTTDAHGTNRAQSGLKPGGIAGIVIAVVVVIAAIIIAILYLRKRHLVSNRLKLHTLTNNAI